MTERKQKNRRARGAKFSEYRLQRLVMCFAQDMTVKDAALVTKLSEVTVRDYFMRIRQRIYDHGFMRVTRRETDKMPARGIFAKKHRGVKEEFAHLYESEFLHRVFASKNAKAFKRFSAASETDMQAIRKFVNYNKINDKFDLIEVLAGKKRPDGRQETRPFDPVDYKRTSTILVNEKNVDPHEAFFRFIWVLLLKHPL